MLDVYVSRHESVLENILVKDLTANIVEGSQGGLAANF